MAIRLIIISIILAPSVYFGIDYISAYTPILKITSTLQDLAIVFAVLFAAALHLRSKLWELPEKYFYSDSEHRRLSFIIESRLKSITLLTIVLFLTMVLLGLIPVFSNFKVFFVYYTKVAAYFLFLSVFGFIILIFWILEAEKFKLKLDRDKARSLEKQRLLNKINQKVKT